MAIVRTFTIKEPDRLGSHSEVDATLSLIEDQGEKFVQIDTYGSKNRALRGKVSQSLRLSEAAFNELVKEAAKHF